MLQLLESARKLTRLSPKAADGPAGPPRQRQLRLAMQRTQRPRVEMTAKTILQMQMAFQMPPKTQGLMEKKTGKKTRRPIRQKRSRKRKLKSS